MSVEKYDPAASDRIAVTPAARAHIAAQLLTTGNRFLRLGVKESGCNGFMYTLDYLEEPGEADVAFPAGDNLDVYVARDDIRIVQGTQVDLVKEGLNVSLKFKNVNAESHCGCGESFSLADESDPGDNPETEQAG